MTTPNGLVLDVFEFSDVEQFLAQNAAGAAEIYRVLQAVVSGALDVTELLRGKERSVLYRRRQPVAPVIHVDNEHSEKYTVLEVVADDAIGLLYRISRGSVAPRLRSRSRADQHRGQEGDRRPARHQGREQAVAVDEAALPARAAGACWRETDEAD